jgi:hypothetical protein
MSVEWFIFWAIVVVGAFMVDRLRVIINCLHSIDENIAFIRVDWDEDRKSGRLP